MPFRCPLIVLDYRQGARGSVTDSIHVQGQVGSASPGFWLVSLGGWETVARREEVVAGPGTSSCCRSSLDPVPRQAAGQGLA